MSGRRHHYIPQFLQRGFASHSTSKDFYAWVYRKGEINPFNSNIKNIGIEGDFYSEDTETILDDAITKAESEFGLFVDELRKADESSFANKAKAAKLIAHLEVRTKNLRVNFRNAGTQIVCEIIAFLENPENCELFIRRQVKTAIKSMIDEELLKRNVPKKMLPIARVKLAPIVEQQIPEMVNHLNLMMIYLRENIHKIFNDSAKSGHIKALKKTHAPPIKVSVYEKLIYRVISTGGNKVPLGDSGVIFHIEGEREFKTVYEKGNKLLAVILPISTTKLLVGSIKNYSLDISKISNAIASCSLEYFISSEKSLDNYELAKLISQNAALLTPAEMSDILSDCIMKI